MGEENARLPRQVGEAKVKGEQTFLLLLASSQQVAELPANELHLFHVRKHVSGDGRLPARRRSPVGVSLLPEDPMQRGMVHPLHALPRSANSSGR